MMNNEMPLLPDLYMPICDVRIVAQAHVKAMQLDAAQNKRHIIVTSVDSVSFKEIALILKKEFNNYRIPTKVGPNLFVRLFSIFDKEVRQVRTYSKSIKKRFLLILNNQFLFFSR